MATLNAADEDWKLLVSFLPRDWKQLAQTAHAMKGLRQDKSEENYLRVLLHRARNRFKAILTERGGLAASASGATST